MKKTPLKRKSKRTIARWKELAWEQFALFIKNRDDWKCVTCGKVAKGQAMNAGHFRPKSLGQVYLFREDNVFAQCATCNLNQGMPQEFYKFMLKKFGQAKIDELMRIKKDLVFYREKELEEIYWRYKKLNAQP